MAARHATDEAEIRRRVDRLVAAACAGDRDLTLTPADDVAFGRSLNRISGALKRGGWADDWLRWTTGWQKLNGEWLIVHDQVSVPIDVTTGKALRDLQP